MFPTQEMGTEVSLTRSTSGHTLLPRAAGGAILKSHWKAGGSGSVPSPSALFFSLPPRRKPRSSLPVVMLRGSRKRGDPMSPVIEFEIGQSISHYRLLDY